MGASSTTNYNIMNKKTYITYIYFLLALSSFAQISKLDCIILKDSLYRIDEVNEVGRFAPNWVKLTLSNGEWGYYNKGEFYAYNSCLKRYVRYTPFYHKWEGNYLGGYAKPLDEPSLKNLRLLDFIFCEKYIYLSLAFDKSIGGERQNQLAEKDPKLYAPFFGTSCLVCQPCV